MCNLHNVEKVMWIMLDFQRFILCHVTEIQINIIIKNYTYRMYTLIARSIILTKVKIVSL